MVLLVRHGKTPTTGKVLPGRAGGLHLSDEGLAQAEAVATRIAALATADRPGPVAVYASPLERMSNLRKPCGSIRTMSRRGGRWRWPGGRWRRPRLTGMSVNANLPGG